MSISQKFSPQTSQSLSSKNGKSRTATDADSLKQNRALLDQITLTRTVALQMSLRVMAAAAATTDEDRASAKAEYEDYQTQYLSTLTLLYGKGKCDLDLAREEIDWIRQIAAKNENQRNAFLSCGEKVKSISKRLAAGDPPTFKEATRFYESIVPTTFEGIKEIVEVLWADLDVKKGDVDDARKTLLNAFNEIRRISTSVRLTAINASVEAARAGDSGRGFSVIASEVKAHAEGIQSATVDAERVINTIIN